ncbi:Uncharacterised protein [Mycobacterium tuberculosis]|nr:Uncharacterised protein [Mycobacterium tuberculosis]
MALATASPAAISTFIVSAAFTPARFNQPRNAIRVVATWLTWAGNSSSSGAGWRYMRSATSS